MGWESRASGYLRFSPGVGKCLLVHSSSGPTLGCQSMEVASENRTPPQVLFTPSGSHCYDCASVSNRDSEKGCLWSHPFLRSPVLHLGNQGVGTASELCCPLCHHPSPLLVPAQGTPQQIDHGPLSLRPCSHSQASQSSLPQNLRLFLPRPEPAGYSYLPPALSTVLCLSVSFNFGKHRRAEK